jgi:branched-chain amino acid transport system permease protein
VRARALVQLAGPVALLVAVGAVGRLMTQAQELEFENALVKAAIVIALYVFIGNSGVVSFGHVSFVAVGAYLSGILTLGVEQKSFVLPSLTPLLRDHHVGTPFSLVLAAAAGGVYALLVGLPLMRLSGLPAGIATFAVLGITYNVLRYWEKVGPAAQSLPLVPESGVWTLTAGAVIAALVAFAYQRSRLGRRLRATREDAQAAQAVGIDVYRERVIAFTLSGGLAGFAGGLLVHQLGSITTDQVYLELTFLTLAMLVVGGVGSLWGAVIGALLISGVDSLLGDAENTIHVGFRLTLPDGTRLVTLGAIMALVLILRPSGLTGGRECSLPGLRRRRGDVAAASPVLRD